MAVYRPSTIPMPDPRWGAHKPGFKAGFSRPLTAEDLALDADRVLRVGTVHDGLAAAIADAQEFHNVATSERQDPSAHAAQRAFRAFWDVGGTYEHPPVQSDVSVGPGAISWPDPDIVPHRASEDLLRRDASAPLRSAMRAAAAGRSACPACQGAGHVAAGTGRVACACRRGRAADPHLTAPEDDAATDFMTSSHARGGGPVATLGAARAGHAGLGRSHARAAPHHVRAATSSGSGFGVGDCAVYGSPPDPAVYGAAAASATPAYDVPVAARGALGAANAHGLYKMPGTIDTTDVMVRRDARVQGVADPYAPAPAAERRPVTDALGFRFPDRAAWGFDVPKFFPARGVDAALYEAAAGVAPDFSADLADMTATRGMEMVEPLSARVAMMREIARDMPHTRDPYMVPRTGPSVLHPGNAVPPAWYVKPGSSARPW